MFFKSVKRPTISRKQSLAGIPVLNEGVDVSCLEDGNALIGVKILRRGAGFWARFQPPVSHKRIKLDELGSFVIRRIDGKKSVLRIVEEFAERFGINRREAELSTAEFLKSLARRGVISMVIK